MESDSSRSSVLEVTLVVILAYSGCLLRNMLHSLFECLSRSRLRYLLDFSITSLFTLFSVTLLSEHLLRSYSLLYTCAGIAALLSIIHNINYFPGFINLFTSPYPSFLPFLTNSRSYINVISCICILAVDFPSLFPHKFGKTRSYGTGLMDVGVGMFIVAHGITSKYARKDPPDITGWRGYWNQIYIESRANVPIFFLGLVRLGIVTFLHKSPPLYEYGTHWNFFFTIGCVKLLSGCILPILPSKMSISTFVTATLMCLLYQYWLVEFGLREFILHAPRSGFYSSNREGLYSCVGFTSLYLYSVSIGTLIFSVRGSVAEWTGVCAGLFSLTFIIWGLLYFTSSHIEPISRRLTNLPYVLWICTLSIFSLSVSLMFDLATLFLASMQENRRRDQNPNLSSTTNTSSSSQDVIIPIDRSTSDTQVPHKDYFLSNLILAIDYNQLVYFLVANILTGLINLVADTQAASRTTAICYLIGYQLVLSYFITVLYRRKIKIKF